MLKVKFKGSTYLIISVESLMTFYFLCNMFFGPVNGYQLSVVPASNNGMSCHESTAQQMVSDPTLVHVLVRFLSGSCSNGTSQHSSQVGPTATQAMHEFLSRLQVHLSSTCPQMFSEFLLKLMHILSTERYVGKYIFS